MEQKPVSVFFDQRKKRWPRIRNSLLGVAFFFSACLLIAIVSIVANPLLQKLNLPSSLILPGARHLRPSPLAAKPPVGARAAALQNTKRQLQAEERLEKSLRTAPLASSISSSSTTRIGFFVNWDDSSLSSLKQNLSSLDMVIGEWLHLDTQGAIRVDDAEKEQRAVDYIRSRKPGMRIVPLINNFDGKAWGSDQLAQMLAQTDARATTTAQLLSFVQQRGYAGVSIDFESIPEKSQTDLLLFMEELYAVFHPLHLNVSINVPFDDPTFPYKELARSSDQLILMAYDEHWSSGDPGPIASNSWFITKLRERLQDLPPSKIVVALGNYAYDWQEGGKNAEERTFEEAIITAKESEGVITLDPVSLNPTFDYFDDTDKLHHVWMLDGVTIFNQLQFINTIKPSGVALWRLGSEDPSLWEIFATTTPLNQQASHTLSRMQYGYDIDYEGRGEILRLLSRPQSGIRDIGFDVTRTLITTEQLVTFPSPYIVNRYGAAEKKIALTFDDGPDPAYTPAILDILKEKQTPGTFFVVGMNGEANADLLKRELAEGHEIGSHTFTHPNISEISDRQLNLELSATERLFESILGRQSLLFRPPYAEDVEPETPDQMHGLQTISSLGYVTVGMQIDPGDWRAPGSQEIVKRVVEAANKHGGNVVLLHDSGGDRAQTIEALPLIIDTLKAEGYEFVRVSDLLGKTRDDIMPLAPVEHKWNTLINRFSFWFVAAFFSMLQFLFFVGISLGIARVTLLGVLAIFEKRATKKKIWPATWMPPSTTVIIPAFNEEKVIVRTVESLLEAAHPTQFNIIVVDDGSKDHTVEVIRTAFAHDARVRVFTKENEGKPAALNFGVAQTDAEIIIGLDADTIFTRETIANLVRHFEDPHVGAVAGNAKVGNRINLLTRWQALEYITSQNLDRRAFDFLNCITVVPGAVGAWRRSLVEACGGFSAETLAEDADLTINIRRLGYRIAYEDEAIALTEAPDTLRGFIKQRFRWMFGTLQVAWKHREALFQPKYGWLGFIALPNIVVFQVIFPLISPIMDLLLLVSALVALLDWQMHPVSFHADNLKQVAFYYALFVLVDLLAATLAFLLEKEEDFSLLIWLFFQRFLYRQLMYYVAIKATLMSLRGNQVGWNKVDRKATVKIPTE